MTLLNLLRTLSLGYFGQHRLRTVLVILSIALGVATLVATQAMNRALKTGVQNATNPLADLAGLLIVNGQVGVPAELAAEIRQANVAGVDSLLPFIYARVSIADLKNKSVWLLGVDWTTNREQSPQLAADNPLGVRVETHLDRLSILEKAGLLLAPPALVSPDLAELLHLQNPKGFSFRLRNAGRTPSVTRIGTVSLAESKLPLRQSSVVVMDLLDASRVCFPEKPGQVHQIGVTLQPGADVEQVRERLQTLVGERADVQTIDTSRQLVADVTAGLEIGFALGGVAALVVGLFLVYNALSVSVAERRHDIGILRSMGATRQQVAGLFVTEALVMGLVGSALGLPVGWLLAWLVSGPMANVISELMIPVEATVVALPVWLMVLAVSSGSLVAVLAALVPALQAAGEEPADAVRRVPRQHSGRIAAAQLLATLLLFGIGLSAAAFRDHLPVRVGVFTGVSCLLLAGLVATPLLASAIGQLVQPLFRYFLGLEGRLAADNLVRAPGRTGLVIAALAATGGLMVQTAGFLKSSREAIFEWIDDKIAADLFVTAGSPVTSAGQALTFQENFADQLRAIPEVEAIMAVRFHRLDYLSPVDGQKRIVMLLGIDPRAFDQLPPDRPLARSLQQNRRLREPGTAVVSANFAALYRKQLGDRITIPGRNHSVDLEIVGITTDYTWNRGTIFVDREWLRQEFADQQVDVFDLFLKPGSDVQAVRQHIEQRYGEEEALFLMDRREINTEVNNSLNKVYSLAYAQQTVIGLVALMGVVSALFISVLQRRRELGLLRAVGATRAQILRSVLAEAILMGLVGAVIGFVIGLILQWYLLEIIILDEAGFTFPFRFALFEAGVVSVAAVTLATLAGLAPAYQATRLSIPEAIAYE
jgi:putative ABC transport system permease protein